MSSTLLVAFETCDGWSSEYDYKSMWFIFNLDMVLMILFLYWSDRIHIHRAAVVLLLGTENGMHKFIRQSQVYSSQNDKHFNGSYFFAQTTLIHCSSFDWQIQSRLILMLYLSIWAASELTI